MSSLLRLDPRDVHPSAVSGAAHPRIRSRSAETPKGGRNRGLPSEQSWGGSVERVTACAAAFGVGVVDREPLLLDGVFEVDRRPIEVRHAHLVDDDLDAL